MPDRIATAATTIDYRWFVAEPGGDVLPQSTAERVVHDTVRLLDVRPGHSVLEIGTGSGYSAALLTALAGPGGRVVSVDIDLALVERARGKHAERGSIATFHAGDGARGWPTEAPFDRIVAWATPSVLPRAWARQAAEGAIVVTPTKAAPIAVANLIVRCRIRDARPTQGTLHPGSFIDMHGRLIADFGVPVNYVDAVRRSPSPAWLSCAALRHTGADPEKVLRGLLAGRSTTRPDPFAGDVSSRAGFLGYLYATRPPELGSASLAGGWGVGAIRGDGAALVRADDVQCVGAVQAKEVLEAWLGAWEAAGRPGLADLDVDILADPAGWAVRPQRH